MPLYAGELLLTEEVIVRRNGAVGHISLNRPKALHALNQAMCEAISAALLEWGEDDAIEAVILDHAEGRGFCAGGDVAMVRRSALEDGGAAGRAFFHAEYRMNHLLFTCPKPVIAFMDGVTMGGGVGLALPALLRVATENTLLAMPETAIGLFPDVGGAWYLSRLRGRTGAFLALTGARFDGAECRWAGLATHYLSPAAVIDAKRRIIAGEGNVEVLDQLTEEPPEPRVASNAEMIDRLFAADRFEDILASLERDGSKWATRELATLRIKCPYSCKVALRQLQNARTIPEWNFPEEMALEYRLAARMIMRPDFAEGVRAVLVDKDNAPRWDPATPEGVTEEMLDAIFAPLPAQEEWTPYAA